MNEENNPNTSENKEGNIVGALHKASPLPTLRTYQGDVAEFIKEKNESVTSIAVKEKEKRRAEEREEAVVESKKGEGFRINFVAIVLSLLLILAGSLTVFFVVDFLGKEDQTIVIKQEIIPYNSELSLANITKETLSSELKKISSGNGVTAIRISDINGAPIDNTSSFLSFVGATPPSSITRTMGQEFFLGSIKNENNTDYFVIISVNDFGRAFSGMLEWEATLEKDLSFLIKDLKKNNEAEVLTDLDQDQEIITNPVWKDVIVRNKDTRALTDGGEAVIAYTFLDKNTVLISSSINSIGEISSIFASRSVIR